jgi:hypothetical protein
MIVNPHSLATVQAEWQTVIRMRDRVQNLIFSTSALDAKKSPAFGDILYNLPVGLAFDVLKQVLLRAKEEDLVPDSSHQLSDLLDSARTALDWIDWHSLREAVHRRAEGAQQEKLFGDRQCLKYLAIIEAQLVAWGILMAPDPYVPPCFPKSA